MGIIFYKEIEKDFRSKGLCQPNTDNISYLGKIFSNQRGSFTEKAILKNLTPINVENTFFWKELIPAIRFQNISLNEDSLKGLLQNENTKKIIENFLTNYGLSLFSDNRLKINIFKQPSDATPLSIEIETFVILTLEGRELFDLMKDEILPLPEDYFKKMKEFVENKYPQLGLNVTTL